MWTRLTFGVLLGFALSGCAAVGDGTFASLFDYTVGESYAEEEETHRAAYQKTKNPEDIRWLLGHRVDTGMPIGEVNRVIGNDGEWISDNYKFRTGGGHYQASDEFYKWGPDNKGGTYVLGFRDGRLVNFDPRDFRTEP